MPDARHLAQSTSTDLHYGLVVAQLLMQHRSQCSRDHLRQMADPCAQQVVAFRIKHYDPRPDRPYEVSEFFLQWRVLMVGDNRCDEPHRTLKQVSVRVLDAAKFLA